MSRASIRQIKSAVDTIVSSTEPPETAALGTALDCAIDILTEAATQSADNEPQGEAYGHLFVLTGNTHGVSPILLDHEKLSVHVVCPGSVPWKGGGEVPCNGWRLNSLYSSSLQSMSIKKDRDQFSLFNRLRKIITLGRVGRPCGLLTDLVLDIQAGPGCSIEGVMGPKEIARLGAGQVVTALVKVKVGSPNTRGYSLSPMPQQQPSTSSEHCKDVLSELEVLLGTAPTLLLTAKLTYRNSLLPTGTRCSTVAAAKLNRSMPAEGSESSHNKTSGSRDEQNGVAVQKRLVYYLATHHAPRHAMLTLQEHFGENGRGSLCPDYIQLVQAELKYQARVMERFGLDRSPADKLFSSRNVSSHTYEHFGQGLFASSNYKPQDWLTKAMDEESSPRSSDKTTPTEEARKRIYGQYGHHKAELLCPGGIRRPTTRPSARQAGVIPSSVRRSSGTFQLPNRGAGDEARKIWGDMRKVSKGDRNSVDTVRFNNVSRSKNVERTKVLKDLAVRNKRSVGTETLMSVQDRRARKVKENVSPWL